MQKTQSNKIKLNGVLYRWKEFHKSFPYLLLPSDLWLPWGDGVREWLESALADLAEWADPLLEWWEPDLLLFALECLDPDLAGDLLCDLPDLWDLGLAGVLDLLLDLDPLVRLPALDRGFSSWSEWSVFTLGVWVAGREDAWLPLRLYPDESLPLSESEPRK